MAGTLSKQDGYRRVMVDYELILAHRLAWFYVHGEWPPEELDHINGCRDDNRIANLRPATKSQNQRNVGPRFNSTSGFKGVSRHQGRWWARIVVDGGRRKSLGLYDCAAAAHFAVLVATDIEHGEFTRT